jgi:hypothetical protein
MIMKISTEQFNMMVPGICSIDTSSHPDSWTNDNPTQGHCAIVSVLAQEVFGGEIVKVSLKGTGYEFLKSHFFNVIDGQEVDFTSGQFTNGIPYAQSAREPVSKDIILSHPGATERFSLLKARFDNNLKML